MANYVSDNQLKILILLALKAAKSPIPLTALADIPALCDINCLSIQQCINELIDQKHIILADDFVKMSDTGNIIIKELENDAPLSLRKKIIAATTFKITELRRDLNVKTDITENGDEFLVNLLLLDGEAEIFSFSFTCPTKAQAETSVYTFKEAPTQVFRSFLGVLIKEEI